MAPAKKWVKLCGHADCQARPYLKDLQSSTMADLETLGGPRPPGCLGGLGEYKGLCSEHLRSRVDGGALVKGDLQFVRAVSRGLEQKVCVVCLL